MDLPNLEYYRPIFMYVRKGCTLAREAKEFVQLWFFHNKVPCKGCKYFDECEVDLIRHPRDDV